MSSNEAKRRARPQRFQVELRGIVQGVGARPFLYRLATALQLTGWVRNDSRGVQLEVQGPPDVLSDFLCRVRQELPAPALLQSLCVHEVPLEDESDFTILASHTQGSKAPLLLPDLAPCAACLHEVCDPGNRRAGYAFTSCIQCGPRFSIVEALPYDRPQTTMRHFTLCPACRSEYEQPGERRFHAQPNACPACGPALRLLTPAGACLARETTALEQAAAALRDGQIVALQGLGGFHLMADAGNTAAIATLRQRKQRPDKPLAVMVSDLAQARQLCVVSPRAAQHLLAPEAPLLLLPRQPGAALATNVAPGQATFGIMLPSTPLHHLLLRHLHGPVVATSGNRHNEPLCTEVHEALARLHGIADVFLVHDRPIARHLDDSVAWIVLDELRLLRRARGYTPRPMNLPQPVPTLLAVGAQLKNTVALSLGQQIVLSQHIGDLDTPQTLAMFERVSLDLLRLYEATPVAIAHDMHPGYTSTHWAQAYASRMGLPLLPVQHHHAHLASCLTEHGSNGPALGVIWDGTGYGPDGRIWGGEFLLGTTAAVRRVAHLRPFGLPGGEAAVREPRRVALALLWALEGETGLDRQELLPVQACSATERHLLGQMLARGLNTPLTTSAGRLFDAIAALLGLQQRLSFEGQAAMALETLADTRVNEAYPIGLTAATAEQPALLLDWEPMVWAILEDLRHGLPLPRLAARFHNAMVEAIVRVAQTVGEPCVALSGGCFQNRWLSERLTERLRALGFQVLLQRQVPPNDGGISLGQVAVAAAQYTGS
ncbi:MAG: carbamoyltransferase HypF [Candidatus Tectimicrobiota bacterium]